MSLEATGTVGRTRHRKICAWGCNSQGLLELHRYVLLNHKSVKAFSFFLYSINVFKLLKSPFSIKPCKEWFVLSIKVTL